MCLVSKIFKLFSYILDLINDWDLTEWSCVLMIFTLIWTYELRDFKSHVKIKM